MQKDDREQEARNALKRLDEQSEKLLGPAPQDHPSDDKIEILGKRIARVLSIVIMLGLLFYWWRTYFSG